jgi:hypothetical protein
MSSARYRQGTAARWQLPASGRVGSGGTGSGTGGGTGSGGGGGSGSTSSSSTSSSSSSSSSSRLSTLASHLQPPTGRLPGAAAGGGDIYAVHRDAPSLPAGRGLRGHSAAAPGPVHPELLRRGVGEFECFQVPDGMSVDERMAQWGHQDIDPAVAASLEPILDMDAPCVRNFDHAKYQRDGYWLWEGIWLPEAREKLVAACHRAQRLNDMYLEGYMELGDVREPSLPHTRACSPTHPHTHTHMLTGSHIPPLSSLFT